MAYYEGIDYWVRYVDFPNMASESVVASHGDGTFTIYINTLFSLERQLDRLEHELRHLEKEHFYRDELTIAQVEHQADGADISSVSRLLPGEQRLSVFRSNALPEHVSFAFYVPDNSFRPYFKKDAVVYCDDMQLRPGDIGLFNWQGETVCRQYNKDPFGITYLFALNRTNDVIVIPSCQEEELICYGRVRTEKKIALPGL